jgi:type II secretory pathway pseudopilin PulG
MITKRGYPAHRSRAAGFTIIELLVALALVLFIMSIVTQAFLYASEAFRSMRAKAELSEKLRYITQTLRADLRSNHFNRLQRLNEDPVYIPPKVGYMRIEQHRPYSLIPSSNIADIALESHPASAPYDSGTLLAFTSIRNSFDPSGFHSMRLFQNPAFDPDQVFLNNKRGGNFLLPGDTRLEETEQNFNSPFAEVAWFSAPEAHEEILLQDEPPGTPPVRLHKLYRKLWMVLPHRPLDALGLPYGPDFLTNTNSSRLGSRLSVVPGIENAAVFNLVEPPQRAPANTDVPMRRGLGNFVRNPSFLQTWQQPCFDFARVANPGVQSEISDFLIADNVLSFTVELMPQGSTRFYDLKTLVGNGPAVFDTWCSRDYDTSMDMTVQPSSGSGWDFTNWQETMPNSQLRFVAIRVTIRLFDTNNALSPTKTTWQATIMEPL